MSGIVVFGGLSRLGSKVTETFINHNLPVLAVRESIDDTKCDEEEEQAMFFGRNAFFQMAMKDDWMNQGDHIDTVICLDSVSWFENAPVVKAEVIATRLTKALEVCPNLKQCLVISHLDIFGPQAGPVDERTTFNPQTETGHQAEAVEHQVHETMRAIQPRNTPLWIRICRTPNVHDGTYSRTTNASLHINDFRESLISFLESDPNVLWIKGVMGVSYSVPSMQ
ncbi:hypothetical protein ACFO4N_15395 [Camelliibacillus cellulosilyticus]|uniref:NAD(P)-binding domain-containing protein n=1 Tax=Camelliibacillus cellulosilyticus TaxID=2174486 RepID=A0ABV9GS42_9BACL